MLGGGNPHHAWCLMPDMDLAPYQEEEEYTNEDKCKEFSEVEAQLPYLRVDVEVLLVHLEGLRVPQCSQNQPRTGCGFVFQTTTSTSNQQLVYEAPPYKLRHTSVDHSYNSTLVCAPMWP